jgi:hypothetical protein
LPPPALAPTVWRDYRTPPCAWKPQGRAGRRARRLAERTLEIISAASRGPADDEKAEGGGAVQWETCRKDPKPLKAAARCIRRRLAGQG